MPGGVKKKEKKNKLGGKSNEKYHDDEISGIAERDREF